MGSLVFQFGKNLERKHHGAFFILSSRLLKLLNAAWVHGCVCVCVCVCSCSFVCVCVSVAFCILGDFPTNFPSMLVNEHFDLWLFLLTSCTALNSRPVFANDSIGVVAAAIPWKAQPFYKISLKNLVLELSSLIRSNCQVSKCPNDDTSSCMVGEVKQPLELK